VLRGPQGTLFGRNALAGAVNIVSKVPQFDEASGYAEVTVGDYSRIDLRAGINLPLGDNAAVMISGVSKEADRLPEGARLHLRAAPPRHAAAGGDLPAVRSAARREPRVEPDSCVIGHQGGEDYRAVRGSFRWQPIDSVTLTLTGDKTWDNSENPADTLVNLVTTGLPAWITSQAAYFGMTYDQRFMTGDPFTTYVSYIDRIAPGTVVPNSAFYNGRATRGGNIIDPINHLRHWGVSGKLEWELAPDIDLTLVYGHREMDETHAFDNDGGVLVGEHVASAIGEHYDNAESAWPGTTTGRTGWSARSTSTPSAISTPPTIRSSAAPCARSTRLTSRTARRSTPTPRCTRSTSRSRWCSAGAIRGTRSSSTTRTTTTCRRIPNSSDIIFQVTPQQDKFTWRSG
jgi:iron complex outermembrane receptor protein